MKEHILKHTKELAHFCRYCNKGFSLAGNKKKHEEKKVCLRRNMMESRCDPGGTVNENLVDQNENLKSKDLKKLT